MVVWHEVLLTYIWFVSLIANICLCIRKLDRNMAWQTAVLHKTNSSVKQQWSPCTQIDAAVCLRSKSWLTTPHSIHLMGFSVGGTFTYYAASQLNDIIAREPIQSKNYLAWVTWKLLEIPFLSLGISKRQTMIFKQKLKSKFSNWIWPQHRPQRGEPNDRARRGAAGAAALAHRLSRAGRRHHPLRRRQTRIQGRELFLYSRVVWQFTLLWQSM